MHVFVPVKGSSSPPGDNVCASARFDDEAAIHAELDALPADATLIQIKPQGSDNLALALGLRRGFPCEEETPEYDDAFRYGPRVWRVLMLRVLDTRPDLVLAFRQNKGQTITEIVDEAKGRGIPTTVIDRRSRQR